MIGAAVAGLLQTGLSIADKFVVDKDKREQLGFEAAQLTNQLCTRLIEVSTVPWVDALVKLLMAMNVLFKGWLRPIGAAAMGLFGAYCQINGVELSETVNAILFGAFPAWGVDRGLEKRRKEKKRPPAFEEEEDWGD